MFGLSTVMVILNNMLYKIVEGYIWPIPQFAERIWHPEMMRFKRFEEKLESLSKKWYDSNGRVPEKIMVEYDELRMAFVTQFPSTAQLVLPTRFGNAIRAFEDYPRQIYGADHIPLWIHLNAVIPKEFRSTIEDARTNVTFLLNIYFFCLVTAVLSIARFIMTLSCSITKTSCLLSLARYEYLVIIPTLSCLLAWLIYRLAVEKIYAWGNVVKAAFDCYLPELASKLGFKLPQSESDRRAFWMDVSRRSIYNRSFLPEKWISSDVASPMEGTPKITVETVIIEERDE
jgi:hypothetical protein